MSRRRLWISGVAAAASLFITVASAAQSDDTQGVVTELKQSMASNREQLMKYQWLQTTEITVKGETKRDQQTMCRFGPDGSVVKTPAGPEQLVQQTSTGGQDGTMSQKKIGEIKEYTDRLKSLISHYVPPDPAKLKIAMQIGNASMNATAGDVTLTFNDYYKTGDNVQFTFDRQARKLLSYNVNTYLDDPKKDIVTLSNNFAGLPDGTSYLQQTVLNAKTKQIQVTTTNSNYSLVGP